jgi:hypothetical protein
LGYGKTGDFGLNLTAMGNAPGIEIQKKHQAVSLKQNLADL